MRSTYLQPLVPHLDHVARSQPAPAPGLDLAVHPHIPTLHEDLRLAPALHEVRRLERLAQRTARGRLHGFGEAPSPATGRAWAWSGIESRAPPIPRRRQ